MAAQALLASKKTGYNNVEEDTGMERQAGTKDKKKASKADIS
eukprot:CAMPEP_0198655172 /NCGR_PEP_ID=MMETSP1467-20131203/8189_1 /TAXON_ID=1462469 /ORGANISM="unid. sp., Strain CCMP2135" /LENGTH=41 /DNA_ID= /DNA_START= /DNA_END= /DNA_ORIENTATION=